jgi:hypothetical protein
MQLSGLRRRLSYANVMATLAFFFALTGASAAGVKYLANGDPAGGDLAGTYPDPTIAVGAITSAAFAPTAKAPDADKLDGIDSAQFLSGFVGGTSSSSTVSVPAGAQGTADNWCPAGKRALGGGYFPFAAGASALRVKVAAFAIDDVTGAEGFEVTMVNEGAAAETFHAQVRCASAS